MADLTANSVVLNLLDLARELAKLSDGLDALERAAVNLREDANLAYAKAELAAEGTVPERKAHAMLATHVERLAADQAEGDVRARKRHLHILEVRIDVGRSAAAALRAEMNLT